MSENLYPQYKGPLTNFKGRVVFGSRALLAEFLDDLKGRTAFLGYVENRQDLEAWIIDGVLLILSVEDKIRPR